MRKSLSDYLYSGGCTRLNKEYKWYTPTVTYLVCGAFLTLMISSKISATLQIFLVLSGMITLHFTRTIDSEELRYLGVMAILPLFYLINMLLHGWEISFLDRPLYLIWYFLIFIAIRRAKSDLKLVLPFVAGGLLISILPAAYERIVLDASRVFGVYGGGDYGNMAAIYSAAAIVGVFLSTLGNGRSLSGALLCAAVMSVGATIVYWSGGRTGIIIIGIGILIGILSATRRYRIHSVAAALLLTMVLGVGLSATESARQRVEMGLTELKSYFDSEQYDTARNTSIGLRLEMLRFGLETFKESPIIGVGITGYRERVRESVLTDRIPAEIQGFRRGLHNQIVDHMVWGGLVGAATLGAFWLALVCLSMRWIKMAQYPLQKFCGWAFMIVTVGYFVVGMLGSLFGSMHGTRTVALLWATLAAFAAPNKLEEQG